jgi:cytosine/adenosine deaminase-related metal-dependent hydrolase
LLVESIAKHPDAVNASEWFNTKASPASKRNRLERPDDCNLLKLMVYERSRLGFQEIYKSGIRVFLYRNNVSAQLASWEKACETGMWVHGITDSTEKFPDNAEQQIKLAEEMFRPECDMAISYEQLVEHWNDTIENIQRLAGWPVVQLPKALKQFPKEGRSEIVL